jgi:alanine racemase
MSKNNIDNHPLISTKDVLRPTFAEVNLANIKYNFEQIKKHVAPSAIMPVLKANAYGHGLVRLARFFDELEADYLGVAVLEEGILLREKGVRAPVLVLGGILGNQIPLFLKYDLTLTASSVEKLEQIEDAAAKFGVKAKVHLKIDTGMERIGVHYYNAENFVRFAFGLKHVEVEGIFSHFANAASQNSTHAELQLERFFTVLEFIEKERFEIPLKHIANSGAILQMPEAHLNLVRPGILLYGVYPSKEVKKSVNVKPALSWKSRIVYFKVIKAGASVGYGSVWTAKRNTRAVTIPVGYGDGYFRSMSGKAQVLINGKRYPVIGNISMDQIVVDIGDDSAYNNDEVVLLGEQGDEKITAEELAAWAGSIPYEILTNINTRVPRIYSEG